MQAECKKIVPIRVICRIKHKLSLVQSGTTRLVEFTYYFMFTIGGVRSRLRRNERGFPVYPVLEFALSEANAFEYPDLRVIIKPIARSAYRSSLESSLRYTDYEGISVAKFGTLS